MNSWMYSWGQSKMARKLSFWWSDRCLGLLTFASLTHATHLYLKLYINKWGNEMEGGWWEHSWHS
jgi:hypothetical protein